MKVLHCPNPICTNTFSSEEVQRAGVVKCPRCGQEFRFKAPTPASFPVAKPANELIDIPPRLTEPLTKPLNVAQRPPVLPKPPAKPANPPLAAPIIYPIAQPPTPPPLALPVGSAPKPALAVPADKVDASVKPDKIVRVRGLKPDQRRMPVLKFIVVTLVVALFLTAASLVIYTSDLRLQSNGDPNEGLAPAIVFHVRTLRGVEERALTLSIDKSTWSPDKEMKSRLKALAAFKRADSDADTWFAVAVQDFAFRNPREGELLTGAIDRLRSQYGDSLQIDTKLDPATIGGLDATCCSFEGRVNVVVWRGSCYFVAHHGFAYWIFLASPIDGRAQQQIAEWNEQKAIAITTERRGWTEQPPEIDIFTAPGSEFSLHAPRGVWRKNDPKTEDEKGVIYLSGMFQSLPNQGGEFVTAKNATFLAVALDLNPDARTAFKSVAAYFDGKKQEESKDYRFERVEEYAPLNAEEVGNLPGGLGEFKLKRGEEPMRYIVLASFNDAAKTYGLRFECAWHHRAIWRKEFQELIKTIRIGAK